ncbi:MULTISPECIES: DMT family transporter [Pseudomonas]|jgi:drug/metabolite transporter (DMT)-like permease|uniref:DMT family transporter n=1 Tax=Pseudomonas synxantha TaxID=47883 RepID=A0A5D3GEH3_9PSED|nr:MULTISPECIES: DMT family transporter [Pseudomonas]MCK3841453.1 DMT family transporter [Pseudomonas sp. NCIMB 10586]MCK3845555.1 DMT family transporter [Pseudomonas sp. W15Feb34]MCK3862281.1 DMT family transporter [Pseudomonas sp. B329]QUW68016.1 DMT family transporter [Pseudomonas synxantha]TYK58833.1 DMT family transporter [Pseudomonas synxantha]
MSTPSPLKLTLVIASVILCWAYSPIGVHMGLHSYSPGQLALLRFLIASLFMAAVAWVVGIGRPQVRDLPWLLVLGFFGVFLHHTSLNHGQQWVTAAASSVLAQSAPLFSVLIAFFCLQERVSIWRWSCVLLGLAGVLVVIWGDHGVGDIDPRGLLILLAACSWSVYFAIQRHFAHRYSPLTMACYMVWSGTLMLCVNLPGLPAAIVQAPLRENLAVLVLGIFPSALAYLAWGYVLKHVEVSRASVAMYLIPPVAMVMAATLLGEQVTLQVMLGAVIVLTSVAAISLEGRWRSIVRPAHPQTPSGRAIKPASSD